MAMNLPQTIKYSLQPYTHDAVVGELRFVIEEIRDYNNGGTVRRTVLRGTVIEGTERGYLFGHASTPKSIAGQTVAIYGATQPELDSGHIVRVAM